MASPLTAIAPLGKLRHVAVPPDLACALAGILALAYYAFDKLHPSYGATPVPRYAMRVPWHEVGGPVPVVFLCLLYILGVLLWLGRVSWAQRPGEGRRPAVQDALALLAISTLISLPWMAQYGPSFAEEWPPHSWIWLLAAPVLVIGWGNWRRRPRLARRRARLDSLWVAATLVFVLLVGLEAMRVRVLSNWLAENRAWDHFWETSAESFPALGVPGVPDDSDSAFLVACTNCFVPDAVPADPEWLQALQDRMRQGEMRYRTAFAPGFKPRLMTRAPGRGWVLVFTMPDEQGERTVFIPGDALDGRRYTFPDQATLLLQSRGIVSYPHFCVSLPTTAGWVHGFADRGWIEAREGPEGDVSVRLNAHVTLRAATYEWKRVSRRALTRVEWAPWDLAPLVFANFPPKLRPKEYDTQGEWVLRRATPDEFVAWGDLVREESAACAVEFQQWGYRRTWL